MTLFLSFMVVICVTLGGLTSAVTNTLDAKYIRSLDLFKSSASDSFSSREHFVSLQKDFDTKINDITHKDFKKAKPFTIKLSDKCDINCHTALAKEFTNERYKTLSGDHAVIFASLPEIEEFEAKHPSSFEYSVAMHPEMKIDSEVRTISHASYGCYPEALRISPLYAPDKIEPKTEYHKVRVILQPLDSEDLQEFLTYVKEMSTSSRKYAFEFEFDPNQSNLKEMRGIIKTAHCEKVTDIVSKLAKRREVVWMEKVHEAHVHNRWARGVCDTGNADMPVLSQVGIMGEDEIVGVADTGIDMTNCYFANSSSLDANLAFEYQFTTNHQVLNPTHRKVIQYVAAADDRDDDEAHGTHVAGTVGGLALDNYGDYAKYNGIAYNSKIAFYDIGKTGESNLQTPGNINDNLLKVLYDAGARVITNSWGTSSNQYDTLARDVDAFMRAYPDALVIFSAGNTGMKGFNTVSSPSTNKNGASVGASLNDHDSWKAYTDAKIDDSYSPNGVAYFSSRGPTKDNRMKPDYLAPGWYTTSAKGIQDSSKYHCTVQALEGTSMAAPTSAGFAVKIRQYYRQGFYPSGTKTVADGFTPSGALIKATLVHSGQKMSYIMNNVSYAAPLQPNGLTDAYPSNVQGYGRIRMDKVLNFGVSTQDPLTMFVVGSAFDTEPHYAELSTLVDSQTYTFTTKAGTQTDVRVTMCYTDMPDAAFTALPMVNTLSVTVTGGGNTFTPYLVPGMIKSNTQMIDIPAASLSPATTYTITVSADHIIQAANSPQPFALVVTGWLTYVDYVEETTYKAPEHSALYISGGAQLYIIVLAVFVFFLLSVVVYFRRITKKTRNLEIDPAKGQWTGEGQAGAMGMVLRMRQRALDKQALATGGGGQQQEYYD